MQPRTHAHNMEDVIVYLKTIISPIIKNPEAIQIEKKDDERGTLLTLTVAKEDMGIVIGKSGDTAKAIRWLLRQWGMTHNARIAIKINEPIK